ncbi:type II secretion system protein [Serpentinicella sp. ANB-PHB4]|uniref:PulJ/GspJ family protein n=1 Tax=Serpentinicella sp. ANB-PHB4 TaxID=3074076 RepID=UPI00285F3500|nr:type II secretion system protein [Serpentinicella sp. ANB-PHB4]MDR5658118.1 type II secretion system protein [Serpentinicella sp. ANB-PHB4]
MKKQMNQKGLTLIEVLVSLALIGLIMVSLIPILTFGFRHVFRGGHRTTVAFEAQQEIESAISAGTSDGEVESMTIRFGDKEDGKIKVNGTWIKEGNIKYFVPFVPNEQ